MEKKIKVLVFAGSTRKESFNKKLAGNIVSGIDNSIADVTHIDLKDYPMPLFDGDLENEHGIPEHGKRFKKLLIETDCFIIASPEYNSATSAVLKNSLDWASRPEPGETPLIAFAGKTAAITSASPGALGGLRGLAALRTILGNLNVIVIPNQLAVSKADGAFDEQGKLKDEKQVAQLKKITSTLLGLTAKLNS